MRVPHAPRVLFVSPDFPPTAGGIQILVHRIATNFERSQRRVLCIADEGGAAFDATSSLETRRVGRTWLPRVAQLALLNARLVVETMRFRPNVIVCAHIVCAPGARLVHRLLRVEYVLYLHADEIHGSPDLARFAMRRAARVIAVSRHTEQLAVRTGGDPARMRLVHPGVDIVPESAEPKQQRPTILTVASMLRRYKGHDVMIRALPLIIERVPDVEWAVVGTGPHEQDYRDLVSAAGLEAHVRFCGRVDDEERDRWFRASHVFAMPSRLESGDTGGEGFGIAYLEASAHGLPVVAGNVAGAMDAVVDGQTGLLVDPTDPEAVAAAIVTLLTDDDRARQFGAAGREWADEHAWSKVAHRVEDLTLALIAAQ